MYVPPHFEQHDSDAVRAAIRAARLATIVTQTDGSFFASHIPMLLEDAPAPHGRLIGHLARANPHGKAIGEGAEALVMFMGPDAYVSPSLYETKREHGKVVPTWNYVAVHVTGRVRVIDDRDAVYAIVSRLTQHHESKRAEPWAVTDAPESYIENQLRGIVGIELTIVHIEPKWKLSQNREERDYTGVRAGLAISEDPADRALAQAMAEEEPRFRA